MKDVKMTMNDIVKVTVWPATVVYDKDSGKFKSDKSKNKWQIAVFTKNNGNMTFANFMDDMTGDAALKKYTGIYKHSEAVVRAAELASEYQLKAAQRTVVDELPAAKALFEANEAAKAKAKAEREAHPEAAQVRRNNKEAERTMKIALKSTDMKFKRYAAEFVKSTQSELARLEAQIAEAAKDEAAKDEKQEELKAIAAAA